MRFGLPTSRACRLTMLLIASLAALVSGCSLDRLVDVSPPTQLLDPALYKSVAGAHTLYNTAVADFAMAYAGDGSGESMVPLSGLLSDELQMSVFSQQVSNVDARFLNDPLDEGQFAYNGAQTARIFATIAATFLRQYAPGLPQSLAGRMYAYEGYEEVMLAEVFCSGIPVSTVDFQGDFEYGSGLTTSQLLTQALALFDSAAALAKDSTPILDLARVGRARALLDLAQYQDAANAVSAVPTAFIFPVLFFPAVPGTGNTFGSTVGFEVIVADREGGNGLDWVSAHDTARVPIDPNSQRQLKYRDGAAPVTLADGIEARLIEAEAQLPAHGGGGTAWLDALNALRTDGTFTTQQDPNDPTVTDTLWHPGTGGKGGLAPLADPGTPKGQVDLLFRERAFWMFATAHWVGDLRRLIRQYGRVANQVYPTGPYPLNRSDAAFYGAGVVVQPGPAERAHNPNYHGCVNLGA